MKEGAVGFLPVAPVGTVLGGRASIGGVQEGVKQEYWRGSGKERSPSRPSGAQPWVGLTRPGASVTPPAPEDHEETHQEGPKTGLKAARTYPEGAVSPLPGAIDPRNLTP